MRILLIHNRYRSGAPGGEDVVVDAERESLRQAGHDVFFYSRSNDEVSDNRLSSRVRVARDVFGSSRTRSDLFEVIDRFKPDVAHVHNVFPLITSSAYDACSEARLPVVQTIHNFRLTCAAATHFREGRICEECRVGQSLAALRHGCYQGSRLASAAVAIMRDRVYRSSVEDQAVSRFIVLTQFASQRLVDAGVPKDRIVVRPNFVSVPSFETVQPSSIVPRDARYAVFSGRLSEEKGLMSLLMAWRGLSVLPLLVIGDGPLRPKAENLVASEGLNVRFLGNLPRAVALDTVARATLQVVPSLWFEGMPLVILEAWALGVPVVGSRIGGIAEMLGHDDCGLLFEPGNAEQLRSRVLELLSDSELSSAIRARARSRYSQRHTPEVGLASLLDVYRSAIGSKSLIG